MSTTADYDVLEREDTVRPASSDVHVFGEKSHVCRTDSLGHATPQARSPLDLWINVPDGFVRLWERDSTLHYRFQEQSLAAFPDPEARKAEIRELFAAAMSAWGDAAPVRFRERERGVDFEIAVRNADDCSIHGCVLASAFFPDAGQHELVIYPMMLEQSRQEQIETMIHELGHIFGLRHFFANVSETAWPAELFGTHSRFSIMNYGPDSYLTEADKSDLKALYRAAWNRELTQINGTPIVLMKPMSAYQP